MFDEDHTESTTTSSSLVDNLVVESTTIAILNLNKSESVPSSIKDELNSKNISKKAKFLDIEDSNVNASLPNGADVWALASLKNLLPEPDDNSKSTVTPDTTNTNAYDSTFNSPESLLVKWSEIMKILNNNDTTSKSPSNLTIQPSTKLNENITKTYVNNELNEDYPIASENTPKEITISSTVPIRNELSTATGKPYNLENNRIDGDQQDLQTNKTRTIQTTKVPTTLKPKEEEEDVTPDKNVEIVDILETNDEVRNKMDQIKALEGKTNAILTTTTDYPETTTTTMDELTTMTYTEDSETTTDTSEEMTYYGDGESTEQDEISKRTAPTDVPSIWTTEPPEYSTVSPSIYSSIALTPHSTFSKPSSRLELSTTTEISPSINDILQTSSESLNNTSLSFSSSSTTSVENISTKSTISSKLPITTTQSQRSTKQSSSISEQSTTMTSIIEFKPMATSESTKQNDSQLYEYSTVKNTDQTFAASSTTFTTELPPSSFSYTPKIRPKEHSNQLDTEVGNEDFVSTVGAIGGRDEGPDVNNIIIVSVTVATIVIVLVLIGVLVSII